MGHKNLRVYQNSLNLVEQIYKITRKFPEEEKFGLISQMRRAAVSIPSNIAEGAARRTKKEFTQFLYISLASLSELETQLEISRRLGYILIIDDINSNLSQIKFGIIRLIAKFGSCERAVIKWEDNKLSEERNWSSWKEFATLTKRATYGCE